MVRAFDIYWNPVMQETILAAFPQRPVNLSDRLIKKGPVAAVVGAMLLVLWTITVGLAWLAYTSWPGIQRDWVISKDIVPLENKLVGSIDGECSTQRLMTSCKGDISYRDDDGRRLTQHFEFTFFSLGSSNYSVKAVRSASHPEWVSLDLAVSELWNRIAVELFFVAASVFCLLAGPYAFYRGIRMHKRLRALSGQVLRPVALRFVKQQKQYGSRVITYAYGDGGREKKSQTVFRKTDSPFMLKTGDALGVTADGQDYVLLLDEALTRLELTDAERNAIWEARDKA